jgi:2,3-bisphosphoglycerate-dependent phosphoglycerate mutase
MFAAAIMKDFKGSNVLIVGHSNTLMPLLDAFGAGPPFPPLAEEDNDMLFKVTINNEDEADLEISYYGDKHHI